MSDYTPTVRLLEVGDAVSYLDFLFELDTQSPFMHYRAGERPMREQGMRSRIKKQEKQGNSFVVLAIGIDLCPIGYFSVNGGNSEATKHSATVAVGVLQNYQRRHIADMLFDYAVVECVARSICRLECTVVHDNRPAVGFYYKHDFRLAGYFRSRFFDGSEMLDELILELLL